MRATLTIARRELHAYFTSSVGYAVLFFFLLVVGVFFLAPLTQMGRANMTQVIGNTFVLLMFLAPALTMRLIAEEKRSGAIELLMTSPVTDGQVIVGKFLGVMAFYCVIIAATFQIPIAIGIVTTEPINAAGIPHWFGWAAAGVAAVLSLLAFSQTHPATQALALAAWVAAGCLIAAGFGSPVFPGYTGFVLLALTLIAAVVTALTEKPWAKTTLAVLAIALLVAVVMSAMRLPERGPIATAYLGMLLIGGSFFAVGTLTSTLTRNQIVAWAVAVVIVLGFLLIDWVAPRFPANPPELIAGAGMVGRFGFLASYAVYALGQIVQGIALNEHLENFARGVLDFRDVFLYLTLIVVFLFFSVRALAATRWQ